jgi:hypothetical protein
VCCHAPPFLSPASRALYFAALPAQLATYGRNNARRQARAKASHDAGVPLGTGTDGKLPNGVQMNLEALVHGTNRVWKVIQNGRVVDRPGLLAWARKNLQP